MKTKSLVQLPSDEMGKG